MIAARIPIPIIAKVIGWSASTMAKMARGMVILELKSCAAPWNPSMPPQFIEIQAGYPQNPPQSTLDCKENIN
jgi:hypothetical protein